MRKHIAQLNHLAHKKSRTILGLMSGTSLDGLDIGLCEISGNGKQTKLQLKAFTTLPYTAEFKQDVRRVFAQPTIDFAQLTILHVQVAQLHAEMVLQALKTWQISPEEVDCIASHGQTVFHAPRSLHGRSDWPNATLQIGDGDQLAVRTGILTISDFRQKHIAAGGEGAPLALYGDYFLFSQPGEERFLLNIGGISNFTYLPADGVMQKAFATDTGPGNTLLDAIAQKEFGQAFDTDSRLALNGVIQSPLLGTLLEHPYFSDTSQDFAQYRSKTTGPEMFSMAWLQDCLNRYPKGTINPFDLMATLTRFTAEAIAKGIHAVPLSNPHRNIYLSGGGVHNPLLITFLRELLPGFNLQGIEALGLNGDAKEACLFAILANETIAGESCDDTLGGVPLVGMGKVSFPG